jgi:16S rRNA (cytosine1402-N4)-methyltransferase
MNREIVTIFEETRKDIFIDCTVGMGGHSYCILDRFKNSRVIAVDQDKKSLNQAKKTLKEFSTRIEFHSFNFINLFEKLDLSQKSITGILIDPGISMIQLKDSSRGFSHQIDSELDMRKDRDSTVTAYEVINSYSQLQLTEIFKKYGEVKNAEKLAKKIIETRLFNKIDSTVMLRGIIETVYGRKITRGKIHPAAQVFQALRIFVNRELDGLESFVNKIPRFLKKGARMIFLTYHSLEDRIVKKAFNRLQKSAKIKLIKPFPGFPAEDEISLNPASRSAKLRAGEVI